MFKSNTAAHSSSTFFLPNLVILLFFLVCVFVFSLLGISYASFWRVKFLAKLLGRSRVRLFNLVGSGERVSLEFLVNFVWFLAYFSSLFD